MKEHLIYAQSLPEGYHEALLRLHFYGDITKCPDYNQLQKECSMTIHVDNPLLEPRISRLMIGGFEELQQYEMEILDGILDFKIGEGWDYTYHDRISKQLPFIYKELKRNPYSRRAVIDVRDWEVDTKEENNSPACLQNIQFFIRNDKLCMKVLMRSNDAVEATFMNMWAFVRLQEKVANELNIEVGSYTHRANSFHCYEKDFGLLDGYVKRIVTNNNLTYNYEGFFKDLMIESIPKIQKKVEELKRQG